MVVILAPLFGFWAIKKLAVIFGRYIGAKFPSNWSSMPNPLRKKGTERLVTEPPKMTLLRACNIFDTFTLSSFGQLLVLYEQNSVIEVVLLSYTCCK